MYISVGLKYEINISLSVRNISKNIDDEYLLLNDK